MSEIEGCVGEGREKREASSGRGRRREPILIENRQTAQDHRRSSLVGRDGTWMGLDGAWMDGMGPSDGPIRLGHARPPPPSYLPRYPALAGPCLVPPLPAFPCSGKHERPIPRSSCSPAPAHRTSAGPPLRHCGGPWGVRQPVRRGDGGRGGGEGGRGVRGEG